MNDTYSKNRDNIAAGNNEESVGPLAGQRLAAARRAHDISIAEIAKELHLDEPKVQALEENQFDVLGAPVFAKGHLRKYAALVGVPLDDVLADYYQLNRAVGAPPVVGPKRPKPPRDIALGPWFFGLAVVIVLAGALYWWFSREPGADPGTTAGAMEPFATDRTAADIDGASEPLSVVDPALEVAGAQDDVPRIGQQDSQRDSQADLPSVGADDMPLPVSVPDREEAASGDLVGGVRLVMAFSGDCWAEVTDANGERLFFGLGKAGQTVIRNGTPPLQALFGEHANVSLTVDGVEFPLSRSGRRGNTARVTIKSP